MRYTVVSRELIFDAVTEVTPSGIQRVERVRLPMTEIEAEQLLKQLCQFYDFKPDVPTISRALFDELSDESKRWVIDSGITIYDDAEEVSFEHLFVDDGDDEIQK